MTTAPALIATGTNSRDRVAPALKKAKSTPSNAEASNLRTRWSFPENFVLDPADRSLAKGTSSETGNFRLSRTRRIS